MTQLRSISNMDEVKSSDEKLQLIEARSSFGGEDAAQHSEKLVSCE